MQLNSRIELRWEINKKKGIEREIWHEHSDGKGMYFGLWMMIMCDNEKKILQKRIITIWTTIDQICLWHDKKWCDPDKEIDW